MDFRDKRALILVTFLCVGLVISACAQIRKTTYPQSFQYLSKTDVQSAMHSLANGVVNIETLLKHMQPESRGETISNEKGAMSPQEESIIVESILEELDGMIAVTDTLQPASRRNADLDKPFGQTNHLLIDEHLDEFTAELLKAQSRLQASPPDFLTLGRVLGSCSGCHRLR